MVTAQASPLVKRSRVIHDSDSEPESPQASPEANPKEKEAPKVDGALPKADGQESIKPEILQEKENKEVKKEELPASKSKDVITSNSKVQAKTSPKVKTEQKSEANNGVDKKKKDEEKSKTAPTKRKEEQNGGQPAKKKEKGTTFRISFFFFRIIFQLIRVVFRIIL